MTTAFQYNGVQLSEPLLTHSHRREAVLDGPTFIYTRYTIHVRGYYNPKSTSYKPGPVSEANQPPLTTDKAVRFALQEPRKALTYSIDGQPLITSPAAGATVDCNNGPTPTVHEISQVWGSTTFLVDMTVVVYILETGKSPLNVIVSNRWEMSSALDEDFFETRMIRGHAIFRTDRLAALGAQPDDYRAWLFPPLIPNYKRLVPSVSVSEDKTRLDYTIVDREMAINIIADGVTRMECMHTRGIRKPGAEEIAEGFFDAGLDTAEGIGKAMSGSMSFIDMARSAKGVVKKMASLMPTMYVRLLVRVWGYRDTARGQLQQAGLKYIQDRMSRLTQVFGSTNCAITHDETGCFVQIDMSAEFGPASTAGFVLFGALGISQEVLKFPSEEVPGVLTNAAVNNPAPPTDQNSRGVQGIGIAPAPLIDATVTPAKPFAYIGVQDRQPP